MTFRLDLASLAQGYADGSLTPEAVLDEVFARISRKRERPDWICLAPRERALAKLAEARGRADPGPLFGVPFAVEDNIDVAGLPTTAGCPAFAYTPDRSATVVERLEAAGAMLVGKTNLDQFATGLAGVRSPYGIPTSVFDPAYISGGSSSGSAVVVAAGLVSFSLGTDTAGSGRVPAAFNNIVGLKPTRGMISARGVVPACRSLDCVSIFAGTVDDAYDVLRAASAPDDEDPFSQGTISIGRLLKTFRFGVPSDGLEFFGDEASAELYAASLRRLTEVGGERVDIDFTPFRAAARLLYGGAFLAERRAALRAYGFDQPEAMHPVVRDIIAGGDAFSAAQAFEATYELTALRNAVNRQWSGIDVLALPTAPTTYRIADVLADPVALNANLGYYTNFVNLLDQCAVAVPAGFRPDGLPVGITIVCRRWHDYTAASIADRAHRSLPDASIGATDLPLPPPSDELVPHPVPGKTISFVRKLKQIAVVGAHLSGQPLNGQLTSRGAELLRTARTASGYSLYALPGTEPPKPGLVRDGGAGGIEVEVWSLAPGAFGVFVEAIPPPLCIGTLELDDGSLVQGFLCEAYAAAGAKDITALGGWRAYLDA